MEYTEILKENLGERRNISKYAFKIVSSGYRAVENGRTTWEEYFKLIGVSL